MLDLFTVVWGDEMTQLFVSVGLPSLLQPGNIPEAAEAKLLGSYSFYATPDARGVIEASPAYPRLASFMPIVWKPQRVERQGTVDTYRGFDVNSNILSQMECSARRQHHMLIVSADWCLGNGSIASMARLTTQGHNPILFGFPKVWEGLFEGFAEILAGGGKISNRRLVELTFGPGGGGCPGKIEVRAPGEWSVRHRTPTPCILPDDALIDYFTLNPTPNQGFDHVLPYFMTQLGYPWHYIPDSDIFFLVERARAWKGSSGPWEEEEQGAGDQFFAQCEEIWRGP